MDYPKKAGIQPHWLRQSTFISDPLPCSYVQLEWSSIYVWSGFLQIFVPIHKEIHWCLAVINKRDQKFQYLDSLGGRDTKVMQLLVCIEAFVWLLICLSSPWQPSFWCVGLWVWVWGVHCCLSVVIFSATETAISVWFDWVCECQKTNLYVNFLPVDFLKHMNLYIGQWNWWKHNIFVYVLSSKSRLIDWQVTGEILV